MESVKHQISQTALFTHEPLDDVEGSIRTVTVFPDLRHGLIQCRIEHVNISSSYRCLSYVWGPPDDRYEVLINEKRFRVRENLYSFLDTARGVCPLQPLWIDAVCINQTFHREKSKQVQQMGNIYANAEEVFIWLGEAPELDGVLALVTDISKWLAECSLDIKNRETNCAHGDSAYGDSRRGVGIVERMLKAPEDSTCGLQQLCSNGYWKRTWIAQELLLGRQIRVLNSKQEISWQELNLGIFAIMRNMDHDAAIVRFGSSICEEFQELEYEALVRQFYIEWEQRRDHDGQEEPQDMLELVGWLGGSECLDARDRVYSLLALVQEGAGFHVDYDEDRCSLFWRAGSHFSAWLDANRIEMLASALDLSAEKLGEDMHQNQPRLAFYPVKAVFYPELWTAEIAPFQRNHFYFSCKNCFQNGDHGYKFNHEPSDIVACLPVRYSAEHTVFRRAADGHYRSLALPLDEYFYNPDFHHVDGALLLRCTNEGYEPVKNFMPEEQADDGEKKANDQFHMEVPLAQIIQRIREREIEQEGIRK